MSIEFRPAKRENVPLLLGFAGGTGSGKTMSALLLARGIAGGKPFAFVDTENGRAKHYADLFPEMHHADITAPFRPQKYADAIVAAESYLEQQGVPLENRVVVVDSTSHEWAGDGGCLDWHDEIMGGDQKKNLSAWIEPKKSHKAMVTRLLQVRAHVILCFRAEPKVEAVRKDGRVEIVPKASLTGLDGWLPITEKMLPYELTASFLLMADAPGVPKPIKLQEQHRAFVALDKPINEETGRRLAEWAHGGQATEKTDATTVTLDDFKAWTTSAHVSAERVRDVGRAMFPGKTPAQLNETELGELKTALEKAPSRREDGNGQAGEDDAMGAEHAEASPGADGTSPPADAADEPGAFTAPAAVDQSHPDVVAANDAAELTLGSGKYKGKRLREIGDDGSDGASYISWLLRNWKTEPLKSGVLAYAKVYVPDAYEDATKAKAAA